MNQLFSILVRAAFTFVAFLVIQYGVPYYFLVIGGVLAEVPNRITLEGHTDAAVFSGDQRGYSNWELSADRANASRRELTAGGLPTEHMLRVQGLADSRPFDDKDPRAPANRRISIIVMNHHAPSSS
jgi:chemotaxis protein MotB